MVAEIVVTVCDVCGKTPAETVGIKRKSQSLQKDLCAVHIEELVKGARAPKRGRPRVASAEAAPALKRRSRAPKAA